MIELTRLNGTPIVLNSDLIKTCEASPDTMVTLVNGEKLIIREDLKQVMQRVLLYRARLLKAVAEQMPALSNITAIDACSTLESAERATQASNLAQGLVSRDR